MLINQDLSIAETNAIYMKVDKYPLTKVKKNFARDFSDGVLVTEILAAEIPRIVEVHNYYSTTSKTKKIYNWQTLNSKLICLFFFNENNKSFCIYCEGF
jgi:hypothetical protein